MSTRFTRTPSGLSNQNAFHGVDFTVYVEGGTSFSKSNVIDNNKYTERSSDIHFWEKLFNEYNDSFTYKFKSIGSKTTVSSIATDILEGNIDNVITAMDSEFDVIHSNQKDHPRILYTYGYSWENDVWVKDTIKFILSINSEKQIDEDWIDSVIDDFYQKMDIYTKLEGYFFLDNDKCIIPKSKCGRLIKRQENPPVLCNDQLKELIKDIEINDDDFDSFVSENNITPKEHCYGHFLEDYFIQIIFFYLKNIENLKNIPPLDALQRQAINTFHRNINSEKIDYYSTKISSIA